MQKKEKSGDRPSHRELYMDFSGGAVVKNLPANVGGMGLIAGSGRSPGAGNGNPLQYSCLESSMDRGAGGLQSTGTQKSLT